MEEIPFSGSRCRLHRKWMDKGHCLQRKRGVKMDGGKAGITIPDDFDIGDRGRTGLNELGGYKRLVGVNSPKEITGNVLSSWFRKHLLGSDHSSFHATGRSRMLKMAP
ncbi:MAG: hypothetical protein ACLU9S_01845 [Oscillospiraceae bacterium]